MQYLSKQSKILTERLGFVKKLEKIATLRQMHPRKRILLASLYIFACLNLIESDAIAQNKISSSQLKNPLYRESLALIEARDYQSAVKSLTSFLENNPSSDEAYFLRGKAYHEMGTLDKATTDYTKAIELNPSAFKAHNNKGLIYGQLKRFDLATKSFSKAISINPEHKESFNNRGVAKAASGDPNGAIKDFTMSIKIDEKYLAPVLNRSFVFDMQGKRKEACRDWKTASRMGSRDATIWLKEQCKT